MRIRLLTISHKVPDWLQKGYLEYSKRLPAFCNLELVAIPAEKRTKTSNIDRILRRETDKLLEQIKPQHWVIALDKDGEQITTEELARKIFGWCNESKNVDLLVGGPEGLSKECLARADAKWSLSKLTFPHTLIRILIAEQIYRACSIIQNHPYHR